LTAAPTVAVTIDSGDTSIPPARLEQLYASISPGIVNIITFPTNAPAGSLPLGQGSGFVIDNDGHIITNQHVIAEGGEIEVDFPSGLKAWAELVGSDPDSDLAVLSVDVPADSLNPLPLGDSDRVQVGEFVIAIGNPFGLSGTMTVGIVSALDRTLDSERAAPTGGSFTAGDIIQTDAAINPGNSGGPLINLQGEVIGVNRAIRTDSSNPTGTPINSGIGFAVPINIVRRVAPVLIDRGEYDYPFLGISSLSEDVWNLKTLEAIELPSNALGAYVTCVTPNGPAAQAGVIGSGSCDQSGLVPGGDLITAIDGKPVLHFGDLLSYLINNAQPGDVVTLTILRREEPVDVDVTLSGRG
jgi:2-alkenal reductase